VLADADNGIGLDERPYSLEDFWLHAESAMLISNAFVLENVHRPVRNRDLWRGLQPLRPFVVDRDKALINAVSMRAAAEKRKGSLDCDWRLRGIVQVAKFVHWLIIFGISENLFFLIRI
jgi:hypothetical protein